MDSQVDIRRRLRRGIALVVSLSALGAVALVIYAGGLGDVVAALRRLPVSWLLVAAGAMAVAWWIDAWRLFVMAPSLGMLPGAMPRAITWWLSLAMANMCATYALSAGTPITGYLLHRRGVSVGKAVAFALVQQTLFVPAALGPACLLTLVYPHLVAPGGLRTTLWIAGVFALLVMIALFGAAVSPVAAVRVAAWTSRGRGRALIDDFVSAVSTMLRRHPVALASAILFSVLNQAAMAAASVALLHGFETTGDAATVWEYSYVFSAVSQAAPTPGGAGVSEIGGAWLLRDILPAPAIAAHLVLWRFLAIQLPILIGGLLLAAELRKAETTS